jgi:hypothetical protein
MRIEFAACEAMRWRHAMGTMVRFTSLIALPVALCVLGSAASADAADLYQARAIVTGQGEANRALGFALCLRDVLVKVSGDQAKAAKAVKGPLLMSQSSELHVQ